MAVEEEAGLGLALDLGLALLKVRCPRDREAGLVGVSIAALWCVDVEVSRQII